MEFQVFKFLADSILGTTTAWSGIAGTLIAWVMAPVLTGLSLTIIWHGYNVIRGQGGSNHLLDVWAKSLRTFLVVSLALTGGAYSENVIGTVTELREGLTGLFVLGDGKLDSYQALDDSMTQALASLGRIMNWGMDHINVFSNDYSGLIAIGSGFFMVFCMTCYSITAGASLLLIDFALAFLGGVGPLFIACFAFQGTAQFFNPWLGTVLKYTMSAVAVAAVIGLANSLLAQYAKALTAAGDNVDFVSTAFAALGASGVLILFALKGKDVAAEMVGGLAVSILSPQAVAGMAGLAAGAAGRGAAHAAGRAMQTELGQDIRKGASMVGEKVLSTTTGQRAVSAAQTMAGIARSMASHTGRRANTIGSSYRSGLNAPGPGGGSGLGSISGSRPVSPGMK